MVRYFADSGHRAFSLLALLSIVCLAAPLAGQELIVNGNFELGNSGFTSGYTYSHGNLFSAQTYDILANPHSAHGSAYSYGDHTTGSGLMMAVNGALTQGPVVWSQTVSVRQNTGYAFGLWISSWTASQPAVLKVLINGVPHGSLVAPSTGGIWQYSMKKFNSGNSDAVTITLVDSVTADIGNDYALDDISLHVCSDAEDQWIWNGINLSPVGGATSMNVVSDDQGGAIVAWISSYGISAQRVAPSGAVLWVTEAILCLATWSTNHLAIISDGAGGAIVTWEDYRSGGIDIYAQQVNALGAIEWTTNGVSLCAATAEQMYPQIATDGAGGAIVTWHDFRSGVADVYAQRVNASGGVEWTTDGVPLCTAVEAQGVAQIAPDGAGGAIVAWSDYRSGSMECYAQRVNASGEVRWAADGIPLCTAGAPHGPSAMISDGVGGAFVTMHIYSGNLDIYIQRVSASGNLYWASAGVPLCTATADQYATQMTSDGVGGVIIAWDDKRGGNLDIYAQRVDSSGVVQWTANGAVLCAAINDQQHPKITSDGAGGGIVAWQDYRSGNWDIYAQRVNATGVAQWMTNGVAVCTATEDQYNPRVVLDNHSGAIVVWEDMRDYWTIYAQRVDGAGHTVCATLLQDYAASFLESGIVLDWTLSEVDNNVDFFVQRSTDPDGSFIELPSIALSRTGLSFSFVDKNWEPGTSYWYRVEYSLAGGRRTLFDAGPIATPAASMTLSQNSPNPFNPSTTIRYYLRERSRVSLEVYDIAGRRVAILLAAEQGKGAHAAVWNGRNESGNSAASGVYFCRLRAGKETLTKKMVLMK